MISRRRLIKLGITTGAVSLLPPGLATPLDAQDTAERRSVDKYVTVTSPSDPGFATKLEELFPGLAEDPVYQKIQSHSVLISNISTEKISAYSTHWSITNPTGGYEATILHYFHRRAKHPRLVHFGATGNKTRFTGKLPLLKAGNTRLVTPYFSWSPNYYKRNPAPKWATILAAKESRKFFLHELSTATGSVVTVDTLIVKQRQLIGSDTGALGKTFSMTRNAEHDEAVSVRRLLGSGASADQVAKHLLSHVHGALSPQAMKAPRLYREVRRRQAAVLLRRLKRAKPAQFARSLKYLVKKPKTSVQSGSVA
jgi:hypothetical protein